MAWPFGPTYEPTAYSAVSPVFEEIAINDPWTTIPLKAVRNKASIRDVLLSELILGTGAKARSAFNWAKTTGNYPLGLPDVTNLTKATGLVEVQEYIESTQGSINVDYHRVGEINPLHAIHQYLSDTLDYERTKNRVGTLTQAEGLPVYLEHIKVQLPGDAPAESLVWEQEVNQRALPWDPEAFFDAQTVVANQPVADTTFTVYTVHLALTPRPGTAAAGDWAENGEPEIYAALQAQPAGILGAVGYAFATTYGPLGYDIEDFLVHAQFSITLDQLGYETQLTYFQTKYSKWISSSKVIDYFTYELGTGDVQAIEDSVKLSDANGDYMPWVFFRSDGESLGREELQIDNEAYALLEDGSEGKQAVDDYRARVRITQLMGLDYQTYSDAIEESEDIDNIIQSFLIYGVPFTTEYQLSKRYLYEFFYRLSLTIDSVGELVAGKALTYPAGFTQFSAGTWYSKEAGARVATVFADRDARMTLRYGGISSSLVAGRLQEDSEDLPINGVTVHQEEQPYIYTDVFRRYEAKGEYYFETREVDSTVRVVFFRCQINDRYYREIMVAQPSMTYTVNRFEQGKGRFTDEVEIDLDPESENADCVIPVSLIIAQSVFGGTDMNYFMEQSLHIVTNALQLTRLKWYQSEAFKGLLIIAAVTVVFLSAGTASAAVLKTYATILAITGSAAGAVILTALFYIGTTIGLEKVFGYVVDELSEKYGFIAAIAAMVAGLALAAQGNPNAAYYMQAANGLLEASVEESEEKLDGLFEEFAVYKESAIEDYDDSLENSIIERKELFYDIGYFSMDQSDIASDVYYDLKIHTNNPGVQILDEPRYYVANALVLPTDTDTETNT